MSFKKKEKLQWTADRLDSSAFLLFIQYFNYDTIEWKAFRKELSSHNLGLIVIKANMFKSYFKDTPYASLNPTFSGPMAILFADSNSPFKGLSAGLKFVKDEPKVEIVAGVYGDIVLLPSKIRDLTDIPINKELLADEGICSLETSYALEFVQLIEQGLFSTPNIVDSSSQGLIPLLKQIESSKQ
jgi:large subunit ribosomal protein L10